MPISGNLIQAPAQLTLLSGYASSELRVHRFADGQTYGGGNLAAAGTVALLAAVANQKYVILRVFLSVDVAANVRLQEAASNRFGLFYPGAGMQVIDLFPFGLTLGNNVAFNLNNNGAAAFNWHATVYYTFDHT